MDTQGNLALSRQAQTQSSSSSPPPLYERLAVARLQYAVNELQTKVDFDRRLAPPVRKVYHCITDDSALVQSIGDFKRWIGEGLVSMLVPLCTLDALDDLKKGTDAVNVNSRESVRYFERCQSGAGRKPVRGVRVQAPEEGFAKWEDCVQFIDPEAVIPAMPPPSPPRNNGYGSNSYYANGNGNSNGNSNGNGNGNRHRRGSRAAGGSDPSADAAPATPVVPVPPKWVQPILNCALWRLHQPSNPRAKTSESEETVLVTNNDIVTAWAKVYNIKVVDSEELADILDRESWEYAEKTRVYNANQRTGNGGRNGGGGGRGGRNGGGRGGHRRDSTGGDNMPNYSSPAPGGGRGGGGEGFILRGAPRGVARGRGKLWEP